MSLILNATADSSDGRYGYRYGYRYGSHGHAYYSYKN